MGIEQQQFFLSWHFVWKAAITYLCRGLTHALNARRLPMAKRMCVPINGRSLQNLWPFSRAKVTSTWSSRQLLLSFSHKSTTFALPPGLLSPVSYWRNAWLYNCESSNDGGGPRKVACVNFDLSSERNFEQFPIVFWRILERQMVITIFPWPFQYYSISWTFMAAGTRTIIEYKQFPSSVFYTTTMYRRTFQETNEGEGESFDTYFPNLFLCHWQINRAFVALSIHLMSKLHSATGKLLPCRCQPQRLAFWWIPT